MARARNIKPSFFTNDQLAQVPYEARLLFIALWCLADREGRLEDRPLRIKAEAFPYDAVDVDAMLSALAEQGLIVRYEAEGKKCIWIPKFAEHQNPHKREKESTIPAFSGTRHDLGSAEAQPRQGRARLNPDSGFLNPESKDALTKISSLSKNNGATKESEQKSKAHGCIRNQETKTRIISACERLRIALGLKGASISSQEHTAVAEALESFCAGMRSRGYCKPTLGKCGPYLEKRLIRLINDAAKGTNSIRAPTAWCSYVCSLLEKLPDDVDTYEQVGRLAKEARIF